MKFTFIDLFAGIGGFHLAMHRLGGECVFASEIDDFARQTAKLLKFDFMEITRNDFMFFFRNTELLNTLSESDRIEVFSTILSGSSDFTKELLDSIFKDYCVSNLEIIDKVNQ